MFDFNKKEEKSYDEWIFMFHIVRNFLYIKYDEQLIVFMAENFAAISKNKKISNQAYKKLDEWCVVWVWLHILIYFYNYIKNIQQNGSNDNEESSKKPTFPISFIIFFVVGVGNIAKNNFEIDTITSHRNLHCEWDNYNSKCIVNIQNNDLKSSLVENIISNRTQWAHFKWTMKTLVSEMLISFFFFYNRNSL